ncbi:MAG TPA: cytochrome c oxidase subunit 3, partial [Sulfuricaulis sp.]|nr:cytochrome c oxidase subunit 3 [Sulfuricaulis sp.]
MSAAHSGNNYYLPNPSAWPVITSAGLFFLALGFVLVMNDIKAGSWSMLLGAAVIIYMMIRWFGQVIAESEGGIYNAQVDRSFRWGMAWFIFSEVMFFAAFFGALFYVRQFSVEWIGATELLWPGYDAGWPTAGPKGPVPAPPDSIPGVNQFSPMGAWGIPAINTLILLSSGATVTWAHWGLLKDNRAQLITGLFLTIALGITFLGLQAYEYIHAYTALGLTLKTGVYGATFFMLTGFHGFHVTMGTIMLIVILGR